VTGWPAPGGRTVKKGEAKAVKPGTVNRELDTLRAMLSRAAEWKKLTANPCASVKRLRVENRRDRILTEEEQQRLIVAAPRTVRAVITLALLTGARIGELLELPWSHVGTRCPGVPEHPKNGHERRIPISPSIRAVLDRLPKAGPYVFTNVRTEERYTPNGVRHVFRRAVVRAKLANPAQITPHTLRHTALSRMIAERHSDHTVMAISGHRSTRMLQRYIHPTDTLKLDALETGAYLVTNWSQNENEPARDGRPDEEIVELAKVFGGRQEARTPDLRVANAALSQLS
jgi:integrase